MDRLYAAATGHPRSSAVLGALGIAFAAILFRYSGVSPATATFFRCAIAVPVLWLIVVAEERRLGRRTRRQMAVGFLAGVCFGLDLTAFHAAIGAIGAGPSTLLANLQVLFVGVVAWVAFGERPSARLLIAVPVALVGIALISGVVGGSAVGSDPLAGVALGLTAAGFYAAYLLILRNGIGDARRVAGPILDSTAASALTGLAVGLAVGGLDLMPGWPALGWLVTLALVAQVAAGQLILVSLPRLPALLTSLILLAQPVGTVVLAVLLLGESPSPAQWLGMGLVLGSLALASLRRPAARPGVPKAPVELPLD